MKVFLSWSGQRSREVANLLSDWLCCVIQASRPWILFEAGALAKGLSTSRVCTLLVDLEPKDIEDPLAQFNHTFPTRESILGLVKTLNSTLANNGLDNRILEQVFNTYWPQFEARFCEILANTEAHPPSKPRAKEDVLGEILENTRMLNSRIRRLEHDVERSRIRDLDMPMEILHMQAMEMAKAGMPIDMLLDRFGNRLPKALLKDLVSVSERTKSCD